MAAFARGSNDADAARHYARTFNLVLRSGYADGYTDPLDAATHSSRGRRRGGAPPQHAGAMWRRSGAPRDPARSTLRPYGPSGTHPDAPLDTPLDTPANAPSRFGAARPM